MPKCLRNYKMLILLRKERLPDLECSKISRRKWRVISSNFMADMSLTLPRINKSTYWVCALHAMRNMCCYMLRMGGGTTLGIIYFCKCKYIKNRILMTFWSGLFLLTNSLLLPLPDIANCLGIGLGYSRVQNTKSHFWFRYMHIKYSWCFAELRDANK